MRKTKAKVKRVNCQKRSIKTEKEAEQILGEVKAMNGCNGREYRNKNLHIYWCEKHTAYHIGNKGAYEWSRKNG